MAKLLSCRVAKEFGRLQLLCGLAGLLSYSAKLLSCRLQLLCKSAALLFCQAKLLWKRAKKESFLSQKSLQSSQREFLHPGLDIFEGRRA
ncbi:hypothetical protein [Candidatus Electronema sp. PJ]|uniref:hypothetical protein n=1 Tax=Candidatus Electronema sp. PJ TaxID=3401572 RepID=UPI003AA837AE